MYRLLDNLSWCLEGIPKGSNICISSLGAIQGEKREDFCRCFREIVFRLKPTKVIFIGAVPTELEEYKEILVRFETPISSYLKLKTCKTEQKEIQ